MCRLIGPCLIVFSSIMQVILVAHNIGGACISYAMECFPSKISKAIFVAASMISNGQRAFDVFVRQVIFHVSLFSHLFNMFTIVT